MITRRSLFGLLAAPAIVRCASLMAVVPVPVFTVDLIEDARRLLLGNRVDDGLIHILITPGQFDDLARRWSFTDG